MTEREVAGPGAGRRDDEADIKRQFALLQSEMRRMMDDPNAPRADDAEADAPIGDGVDGGLDDGAEDGPGVGPARLPVTLEGRSPDNRNALVTLLKHVDQVGRQAEADASRVTAALHQNRRAIMDLAERLEGMERRRRPRLAAPLIVLLILAGIAVVGLTGRAEPLLDAADTGWQAIVAQTRALTGNDQPEAAAIEPATPAPKEAVPAIVAQAAPQPAPTAAAPPAPEPVVVVPQAAPARPAAQPAPAPATAPASADGDQAAAQPAAMPTTPIAAGIAAPAPPVEPPVARPVAPPVAPPVASPVATPVSLAPAAAASAAPGPAVPHLVVLARTDSWVQVRNRQGGVLLERILHAGDSWPVPDQPGLTLSTGNAGGIQILIDGTPAPSLGVSGAIRRDVKLDAAALRAAG